MKFAVFAFLFYTFDLSVGGILDDVKAAVPSLPNITIPQINLPQVNLSLAECSKYKGFNGSQSLVYGKWKSVKTTANLTCEMYSIGPINPGLTNTSGLVPIITNFTFFEDGVFKEEQFIEQGIPVQMNQHLVKQVPSTLDLNVTNPIFESIATYIVVHLKVSSETLLYTVCPIANTSYFSVVRINTRNGSMNAEVPAFEAYAVSLGLPLGNFHETNNSNCYPQFYV